MPLQVRCKNCAHYRNQWCEKTLDSPDPDRLRDCKYYRALTNADRLNAMTTEEKARFLCKLHRYKEYGQNENADKMCEQLWLDWLKQEVEESEN